MPTFTRAVSSTPVAQNRLLQALADFRKNDDGAAIPLVIALFVFMIVSSGMAVDFMRQETARADLQNALDRGVLAAADLEQTLANTEAEAKELINGYMASRSFFAPLLELDVDMPNIPGGRRISATASYEIETFFLKIMGFDTFVIEADAQAEQAAADLEIALILDVSQSMTEASTWNAGGTRLSDLKTAAKQFIDKVLTDENKERVAISIIPYSAQVNLSDEMAAQFNIQRHHNYGNCVNFAPLDYQSTAVTTSAPLAQTQHFADGTRFEYYWYTVTEYFRVRTIWGYRYVPYRVWRQGIREIPAHFICPQSNNEILAFSNNALQLKGAIDAMTPEGWTAAYTGMKWGVALLDPAARPMVNGMINAGQVDDAFRDWPRDWSSRQTRKVFVLMTDGRNTIQYKMNQAGYESQTPEYWNTNPVPDEWLETEVDNDVDGLGDDYLEDICDAAKDGLNAIIYTIGFELQTSPAAAAVLEDCASSPSTHYLVEAVNIDLAFSNIAAQIENLKLTQ